MDCISRDITQQMTILNMIVPILMQFFACKPVQICVLSQIRAFQAAYYPTKCEVTNDLKLLPM